MAKDVLLEIITDTYRRTLDDNQSDFEMMLLNMSKLCTCLFLKGILTKEEVEEILKLERINGEELNENKN